MSEEGRAGKSSAKRTPRAAKRSRAHTQEGSRGAEAPKNPAAGGMASRKHMLQQSCGPQRAGRLSGEPPAVLWVMVQ